MDKKTTGIVAYITWVGLLLAFILGDREGAKFHLNQALVLWIAALLDVVFGIIPVIGGVLASIYSILLFVGGIIGLIGAINGEEKKIPIIGDIQIIK